MPSGFHSQSSAESRHSGVSVTQTQRVKALVPACHTNTDSSYWVRPVTQTQRVKALGPACHTNTESQGTGSGLSHRHRESRHWVRPVTQTQRVKALGPAYHTKTQSVKALAGLVYLTESQGTGSGLSYKRSESARFSFLGSLAWNSLSHHLR